MSLCLFAAGKMTAIGASAFTLAWTHSVERTAWEEDWRLTARGLEIIEARVKGSGAGMEPPEDARLSGGWWRYRPALPPLPTLQLATSGATAPWRICTARGCREIPVPAGDMAAGGAPGERVATGGGAGAVIRACPEG